MVTATRLTCKWGHELNEITRRIDKYGVAHCRICSGISWAKSRARRDAGLGPVNHYAERNLPDPRPEREPIEAAKWHIYQLAEWELGYTPEHILRRLREWFIRRMAHCPSVLVCSPSMAAELREYIRGNRAVAARWEGIAIREDETAEEGWFGLR